MSAGQDPKSSCTGVSLFFDFLICVNCVSFCYFFLKGWSSAMKHRDSHDPSYFTLMSLYERFTKERGTPKESMLAREDLSRWGGKEQNHVIQKYDLSGKLLNF